MISKKYFIVAIGALAIYTSIFWGVKKMDSHDLDGTYYAYSDYGKENIVYFDTPKIIIKGNKLTYITNTEGQGNSVWDLNIKKKTISYAGEASTFYTVKDDVFSFYGKVYVKEGSRTYKNIDKHK